MTFVLALWLMLGQASGQLPNTTSGTLMRCEHCSTDVDTQTSSKCYDPGTQTYGPCNAGGAGATHRLGLDSEPIDGPAIIGKDWQVMIGGMDYENPHEEWKVIDHLGYMRWWTCADKERILEVSESGKHYCHRIQP